MTPLARPWIDVSVTVRAGMAHWPDNPPIYLERAMDMTRGDDCNVSHMAMGVHTGTHMDGPVHFVDGGAGLDDMPLDATIGAARVIEITDAHQVTADELARPRRPGPRHRTPARRADRGSRRLDAFGGTSVKCGPDVTQTVTLAPMFTDVPTKGAALTDAAPGPHP
jgi:hypothetical protein